MGGERVTGLSPPHSRFLPAVRVDADHLLRSGQPPVTLMCRATAGRGDPM
jgi:hypothetical protein